MSIFGLHALLTITFAFVFSPVIATVEDAALDIVQTYDLDPSTMSFGEQARVAPKLSELWDRFDKEPEPYREAMRTLLRKEGQREMLYCDGGMLLLEKATQASDKELGLQSLRKCSLSEIQHTPYFYTMHALAMAGTDTLELQFKMLTRPKYQVYIAPHALTLGQDYSFLYPLLVQDETRYTAPLIERIKIEKDPTAFNTLMLALFYSALPEAEATIHSMAQAQTIPAGAREQAKMIEDLIDEARRTDSVKVREMKSEVGIASNSTEKDLREARRKRMRAISDEALSDLDIYTLLIYQARAK